MLPSLFREVRLKASANYGHLSDGSNIPLESSLLFLQLAWSIRVALCHSTSNHLWQIRICGGANEKAARIMGLDVLTTKMLAFVLSGLGSALSGVFRADPEKQPADHRRPISPGCMAAVVRRDSVDGEQRQRLKTLLGVVLVLVIQNGLNIDCS